MYDVSSLLLKIPMYIPLFSSHSLELLMSFLPSSKLTHKYSKTVRNSLARRYFHHKFPRCFSLHSPHTTLISSQTITATTKRSPRHKKRKHSFVNKPAGFLENDLCIFIVICAASPLQHTCNKRERNGGVFRNYDEIIRSIEFIKPISSSL